MSKKVLTIIPFFNSAIHYGNADLDISLDMLKNCFYHTYESVAPISDQIVVSFTNKEVMEEIIGKRLSNFWPMYFPNITTDLLPSSFCATLLQHGFPHDYVFYTEPDQVVSYENFPSILETIDGDDNVCITPHLIQQTPVEKIRNIRRFYKNEAGHFYQLDYFQHSQPDSSWFCLNDCGTKKEKYNDNYYINTTKEEAYSGSYICSANFFKNIKFTFNRDDSTKYASGWDAFNKEKSVVLKPIHNNFFNSYKLSSWQYNNITF